MLKYIHARPSQKEPKRRRESTFIQHLDSSHIIYMLHIRRLVLLKQETAVAAQDSDES